MPLGERQVQPSEQSAPKEVPRHEQKVGEASEQQAKSNYLGDSSDSEEEHKS